jgi:hypothetical protein
MEVSGQFHASAVLPPGGNILLYPLCRKLGGPQSQSGHYGEEKYLPPLLVQCLRLALSK